MSDVEHESCGSNPFRSSRVRPGAIPYLLPEGIQVAELVAELRDANWRGAIVGPHGSGKTTLLRTIEPHLKSAGRELLNVELHDGQRRLPIALSAANVRPQTIVVVDGYEQLSWLSKMLLHWRCRRLRCGLLVTSHVPMRLPTLFTTHTDSEQALAVVRALLPEDLEHYRITAADVARAHALHSGNIREVLFGLYDVYRQRHESAVE
jgi:ABC-type branched-subunit amino acid transport system ATPase component